MHNESPINIRSRQSNGLLFSNMNMHCDNSSAMGRNSQNLYFKEPAIASSFSRQTTQKPPNRRRGGITVTFPQKLHAMLCEIERDGQMSSIVSWHPEGKSFLIHNTTGFVAKILPTYFRQSKFQSFQRQLNAYSFNRQSDKLGCTIFYHDMFIRGDPELCKQIKRAPSTKRSDSPTKTKAFALSPMTKEKPIIGTNTSKLHGFFSQPESPIGVVSTASRSCFEALMSHSQCTKQNKVSCHQSSVSTTPNNATSDQFHTELSALWDNGLDGATPNEIPEALDEIAYDDTQTESWTKLLRNWDPSAEEIGVTVEL